MMLRLYLAGPMTGYEDYNIPAFDEAARRLREKGFYVISPADTARQWGTEMPYNFYLKEGLRRLLNCDGVALLDRWHRSKGATLEVTVARQLGLDIRMLEGWL